MEWISVKDRLPRSVGSYLVVYTDEDNQSAVVTICAYAYFDDTKMSWKIPWWDERSITHWMPLPEPPKEEHP